MATMVPDRDTEHDLPVLARHLRRHVLAWFVNSIEQPHKRVVDVSSAPPESDL